MSRLLLITAALAGMQTPVVAQSTAPQHPTSNGAESLATGAPLRATIARAPGPIELDGRVEDAGWRGAQRLTGFTEFNPGKLVAPPVETEVMLAYDDEHLYVAFIARDDPSRIRATLRDRDQIGGDDVVGILLDTYGDGTSGFFAISNALGVQADSRFTASDDDDSFDMIFETEGRITDDGYIVEMAIPFRSMRFPDRPVQTWRVNFYRKHPRSVEREMTWAALDLDNSCVLCQSVPLVGVEGIRPGGNLELLPSLVASQAGARESLDASFENADPTAEVGLGAKYAFQSGWTAEATLNPDYSQVESDAAQIDVNTTFALFFDERRPFFQEGAELFDTWMDVVYTRSINDPLAAAKLTGRVGGTRVAFLGGMDEHTPFILPFEERSRTLATGRSVANVLRLQHDLGSGSHVGALLTDRRLEGGGAGSNVAVDLLYRFAPSWQLEAQVVGSYTDEPMDSALSANSALDFTFGRGDDVHTAAFDGESYWGRGAYISVERSARFWSADIDYWDATPTYRSDLGFQTNNDFRRVNFWSGLNFFFPQNSLVTRLSPQIQGGAIWNFGGVRKDIWVRPQFSAAFARQTYLYMDAVWSHEVFRDVGFPDIRRFGMEVNTTPVDWLSVGFWTGFGTSIARYLAPPQLGDSRGFSMWGTLKPFQRLVIQPELSYQRLDVGDPADSLGFEGYVLRTRAQYQFTRELFVRLVAQYNEFDSAWDFEPLLIYRLNPFSIFYLGSTLGYEDSPAFGFTGTARQYFLKFQYLFRL